MFPWQFIPSDSKRPHEQDGVVPGVAAPLALISLMPPLLLPHSVMTQYRFSSQQMLLTQALLDLIDMKDPVTVLDSVADRLNDDDDDDDPLLKAAIFDLPMDEVDELLDPVMMTDFGLDPEAPMARSSRITRKRPRQQDMDNHKPRLRHFQAGQWTLRFQEMCDFHQTHGHCLVPYAYEENPTLARWVKRQRYQYKLFMDGEHSTMTRERIEALTNIGFVWDSHTVLWHERLQELKQFKTTHGHCLVPTFYEPNPQLATWTKCQRRQYKLYCEKKPSHMTAERIAALEKLGFAWELRGRLTS